MIPGSGRKSGIPDLPDQLRDGAWEGGPVKPIAEQSQCSQLEGTEEAEELECQSEEGREEQLQSQHEAQSVGHRWEPQVGTTA